jgi:Ras-related protein Rab-5C
LLFWFGALAYAATSHHSWNISLRFSAERYASVAEIHFRGAQIGIVVFSLIDESSFEAVPSWVERVRERADEAIICIVGNKLDLAVGDDRAIQQADAEALAAALGASYTETSALTGEGIDELFSTLANKVPRSAAIPRRAKVEISSGGPSGGGGCNC